MKTRRFKPCGCKYQTESSWGYDVQRWIGGRKSWRQVGHVETPERAGYVTRRIKTVLIRCNGCGADMIREYPAKP